MWIFVIDDEVDICELIDLMLLCMGLVVECVGLVVEVWVVLNGGIFQFCLIDMCLLDGDGLEIVCYIGEYYVKMLVVVIIVFGSVENVVVVFKVGVFDYLVKLVGFD